MSKQKLELQVNIPTTIKLLQTEPAKGENAYGRWYLYNVECQGSEYSYFAPEKVVKLLKENAVTVDDEVVITKKLIKSGKKNITDYEVCVLENEAVAVPNHQANGYSNGNGYHNSNSNVNSNGNSKGYTNGIATSTPTEIKNNSNSPVLSKDYQVMLQCMTEALMIRDELGHDMDVNKLGITLFLRKVKP